MLFFMFSLAGLPPFMGFYAKLSVLQAVLGAGHIWLAVAAVMFSLIGAFYYLRVVKLMYFDTPSDSAPIVANNDMRVALSLNGVAILALGILPGALMNVCEGAINQSLQVFFKALTAG
jgi:NADH-quinone oxidoreductase subunit N